MFESLQQFVPLEWRGAFAALIAPLTWLPGLHAELLNFAWYGDTLTIVLIKRTLLLLPVLLMLTGLWTTMLSAYTVPFRSGRSTFLTTLVMSWWDLGRSVWFFWAGVVRVAVVALGWIWSGLRFGLQVIVKAGRSLLRSPLLVLDWTSRSYFKPGVPWIAFLALLLWCGVESTIFLYTLSPTMSEVLAGITGYEPNPLIMSPILWIFLFLLILGSFACVQVFAEAIRNRKWMDVGQMAFVEAFVMFFEVVFLYRELIDAVTPWIAQTTNEAVQLGLVSTLLLACFGWIGVRGMTWFLFGRFGTPAVLAILSRETVMNHGSGPLPAAQALTPGLWREPVTALKEEIDWFKKEGRYVFELITLPVLQLLAAAVNFVVVVIAGRPVFSLPFKNLNQVMVSTADLGFVRPSAPRSMPAPKRAVPAEEPAR